MFFGCKRGYTPMKEDKEWQNLRKIKKDEGFKFPPETYGRADVIGKDNKTISKCFTYRTIHLGWSGTCISSAKNPGDRGYCQNTPEDKPSLADPGNPGDKPILEMKVLEKLENGSTRLNWGVCSSISCNVDDVHKYTKKLQEAKLSLVNESVCHEMLKGSVDYNSKTELCAAKHGMFKIRNYRKYNDTKFRFVGNRIEHRCGGVDACEGDSGIFYYF